MNIPKSVFGKWIEAYWTEPNRATGQASHVPFTQSKFYVVKHKTDEIQKKEKENKKKSAKSAYVSTRKLNDCPPVGFSFFLFALNKSAASDKLFANNRQ